MECSSSKRRGLIITAAILLTLSVIGLVIISVLFVVATNIGLMYAVVLDAGSTSTKLNLYEWEDNPFRTNAPVEQIANSRVTPGISSYNDNPFEAYKQLEAPLRTLVSNLSESRKVKTPVYLAATAGMRLKLIEDPMGSMDLFEVLRRGLLSSGLLVQTPNERIRMLSGSEEGLFGWISVNYILRKITDKIQVPPSETVGALDLGGASTQIAFVPTVTPTTPETSLDMFPLKLFGKRYDVYSHSFLCYGKNEFEKRTKGAIIGTTDTAVIDNPCLLNGYESNEENAADIFAGPCMAGSYAKKVFVTELTKPQQLTTFKFRGTGKADQCLKKIQDQFQTTKCTHQPCSFNNVYQPPVAGDFRAFAGFSYVTGYLFPKQTTGITKTQFEKVVTEFCNKPWAEIEAKTPVKQRPFVAKYCFDGLFVMELLNNYGFKTDDDWKKITFGEKVEGTTVSWALGYMLDQSGFLPSESPPIHMPTPLYAGLFVVLAVLMLISIVLLALVLCGCIKSGERFE